MRRCMKKTIGIFAHVDAGKTTFTEELLYLAKAIGKLGSVDKRTSVMDTNEIEKRRGITIFAGQGYFDYGDDRIYVIDTPGHTDFSAETERAMEVLDAAVLLVSGTKGVEAHTVTLFHLLSQYQIPVFFFVNKMDLEGAFLTDVLEDIRYKLTEDIWEMGAGFKEPEINEERKLFLADRDDTFMEQYLMEEYTREDTLAAWERLLKAGKIYPVFSGSAQKREGIEDFLNYFSTCTFADYTKEEKEPLKASVFKIRHDEKGNRIVYVKVLSGRLRIRDEFSFLIREEVVIEKIHEIRLYQGEKFQRSQEVLAGDVAAVIGLKSPVCGTVLTEGEIVVKKKQYRLTPALESALKILDQTDKNQVLQVLSLLEEENPVLSVSLHTVTNTILVHVMGKIQLEVLEEILAERYGIKAAFEKPMPEYRETITAPVLGWGHFEPLRHYAEVCLWLRPGRRGSGITFSSECHVDDLAIQYQHLIQTHVFEKQHLGVLTGSPLEDVEIVLKKGRAHIKHTEGGDFREAVYRAIRQGLEKADSILLEPFYRLEFYVEQEHTGKIMSDIKKRRGTFEPPSMCGKLTHIRGRGPVAEFVDYTAKLASATQGKGSLSLYFDGYDICENQADVIEAAAYEKEHDLANTSSSVFCAKGAAFTVNWQEAETYMHTRAE